MRTFFVRLWLLGEDGIEVETWAHELVPTSGSVIPLATWAKEVIELTYDDAELRDLFKLPAEGNYQVLTVGTLKSVRSDYDGTWEDEVEFNAPEVLFAAVPDEYLRQRDGWEDDNAVRKPESAQPDPPAQA